MTDKELHKLGRRELLQLMLAQGREAERAKAELAETLEKLGQLEAGYERLKRRLDDKDAQIHKLRSALQAMQEAPGGYRGGPAQAAPFIHVPDDYYAPPVQQEQARPAPPGDVYAEAAPQPARADPIQGARGDEPGWPLERREAQEPRHYGHAEQLGAESAAQTQEEGPPALREDTYVPPAYDEVPREAAPPQQQEEARPVAMGPTGGTQVLQAVKIVNGKVVSQGQVVRPKYQ